MGAFVLVLFIVLVLPMERKQDCENGEDYENV